MDNLEEVDNNINNGNEPLYPKQSIWKTDIKVLWQRFKDFAKTPRGKRVLIISGIILIVLVVLGITVYNRYFRKEGSRPIVGGLVLPSMNDTAPPKKAVSPLDGQSYLENVANRHPLAIMVENHPDARPQSGLDKAKVIYEAVTEGGITRFMAVYGPESANKVGPVRSARTIYLDWDLEYDAFYAHVGGNIDALDLIPQLKIKDLDQFRYGDQAYWRVPQAGKATEHTMYTDTDKLWKIAQDNKWSMTGDFEPLGFKEETGLAQRPESQNVTINFSTDSYKVTWKYDKATNTYSRYQGGIAHKDAITGNVLQAKNIIIPEIDRTHTPTRINEESWTFDTVGSGAAKIIMDGSIIEGTWKKPSHSARMQLYDSAGNKIKFNPGVFWYEALNLGMTVTIN